MGYKVSFQSAGPEGNYLTEKEYADFDFTAHARSVGHARRSTCAPDTSSFFLLLVNDLAHEYYHGCCWQTGTRKCTKTYILEFLGACRQCRRPCTNNVKDYDIIHVYNLDHKYHACRCEHL